MADNRQKSQDYIFRLKELYAIPRQVTEYHLKIQPYLVNAMIAAYNMNEEAEGVNRAKIAEYFGMIVSTTICLANVKEIWEEKHKDNKDLIEFTKKIAAYAQKKIRTSEIFHMYQDYAEVLNEAGLLEAYDRRESLEDSWNSGF